MKLSNISEPAKYYNNNIKQAGQNYKMGNLLFGEKCLEKILAKLPKNLLFDVT